MPPLPTFFHRDIVVEIEPGVSPGSEVVRGIFEPGGTRAGPLRIGMASIGAACEHLARMFAQRRHEHVKRSLYRRVVSVEIGGRLLEPIAESRPAGEPREHPIKPGSGRVHTQPPAFKHALEPRPVPDRDDVGLLLHAGADVFDEDIQAYCRVVRPASRKTVVEEYVDDDSRVAPAGSGDIRHACLERVVAIREPIDGAVQRDTRQDSG